MVDVVGKGSKKEVRRKGGGKERRAFILFINKY
jgi:hypothetical protein